MFRVTLAGRLGKDPETRYTPSGQKVTTLNMAVNSRKGKEDVTIWVRVTVWGEQFDKIISYLKKGSALLVFGKMNPPSSYVNQAGQTQYSIEVTAESIEFSPFGGNKEDGGGNHSSQQDQSHGQGHGHGYEESSYENSGHGKNQSYGSKVMAGHGSQHGHDEDDALPF